MRLRGRKLEVLEDKCVVFGECKESVNSPNVPLDMLSWSAAALVACHIVKDCDRT